MSQTNAAPFVSFCVPAYRRPHLLREALASIAAQNITEPWEAVVCDDGGLPETAAIVTEFPSDRFFLHKNHPARGAVGNWNRCMELARGTWVSILHEDDVLFPWCYELVRPRLRAGVAAVCTRVVQGERPPTPARPDTRRTAVREYRPLHFLKSSFTPFPGVFLPRELARRIGGFDERWDSLADYEFWYRLNVAGPVEVVRASGAFYRVAEGQWTETEWPAMLRRMHLLRLRIAREQLPRSPRLGRWCARFFTQRAAQSYARRFSARPAALARALQFRRIVFHGLPSGWVWQAIKLFA